MPLLAGLVAGLRTLHNEDTLAVLFAWNVLVFTVFLLVNRFYALKHADLPPGEKPTWGKALYVTAITHFAFSPPGDFPAKDTGGRAITATHAFLSWISLFWTIFTLPSITRRFY